MIFVFRFAKFSLIQEEIVWICGVKYTIFLGNCMVSWFHGCMVTLLCIFYKLKQKKCLAAQVLRGAFIF